MGISAYFEITVFDNGHEKFFFVKENEKPYEQYFYGNREAPMNGHSLSAAFHFYVDPKSENGYRIELTDFTKTSKYDFKVKLVSACKWVNSWNNPIEISCNEFIDILKNNIAAFDCSDNKPAQNCTFGYRIVNEKG